MELEDWTVNIELIDKYEYARLYNKIFNCVNENKDKYGIRPIYQGIEAVNRLTDETIITLRLTTD